MPQIAMLMSGPALLDRPSHEVSVSESPMRSLPSITTPVVSGSEWRGHC